MYFSISTSLISHMLLSFYDANKVTVLDVLAHDLGGHILEVQMDRTFLKVRQQSLTAAHWEVELVCRQLPRTRAQISNWLARRFRTSRLARHPGKVPSMNFRRKTSSTVRSAAWSSPSRLPERRRALRSLSRISSGNIQGLGIQFHPQPAFFSLLQVE